MITNGSNVSKILSGIFDFLSIIIKSRLGWIVVGYFFSLLDSWDYGLNSGADI